MTGVLCTPFAVLGYILLFSDGMFELSWVELVGLTSQLTIFQSYMWRPDGM